MARLIDEELSGHDAELSELHRLQDEQKSAIEGQDFDAAAKARVRELAAVQALAETSTLDVGEVQALCETVIDAARADLRGG